MTAVGALSPTLSRKVEKIVREFRVDARTPRRWRRAASRFALRSVLGLGFLASAAAAGVTSTASASVSFTGLQACS